MNDPPIVLIVDDHPNFRKMIREQLEYRGLKTLTAFSGNSAIQLMDLIEFDYVLTDYFMPDGDGLSVIEYAQNNFPSIKLIVWTSEPEKLNHLPDWLPIVSKFQHLETFINEVCAIMEERVIFL